MPQVSYTSHAPPPVSRWPQQHNSAFRLQHVAADLHTDKHHTRGSVQSNTLQWIQYSHWPCPQHAWRWMNEGRMRPSYYIITWNKTWNKLVSTAPVEKQGTVGRWRAGAGTLTGCIMLTHYICCGSNSVQLHTLTLLQNLTDTNPAIRQFLSLSLCQALLWMVGVFPLSHWAHLHPSLRKPLWVYHFVEAPHTRLLLVHGPALAFVLASPVFSVCTSSSHWCLL